MIERMYMSLHSHPPCRDLDIGRVNPGGWQTTCEVAYPGYARIGMVRYPDGGWHFGDGTLAQRFSFPQWGQRSDTLEHAVARYWAVGNGPSGAGGLIFVGEIAPHITLAYGVTAIVMFDSWGDQQDWDAVANPDIVRPGVPPAPPTYDGMTREDCLLVYTMAQRTDTPIASVLTPAQLAAAREAWSEQARKR